MDLIELLVQYGLTRQEASLYLALRTEEALSGYEIAKLTGISRSNTYNGLASLVDKGAAYVIEGTVVKYTAVSMEEFCDNKIRYLKEVKQQLLANIPNEKPNTIGYITIQGRQHIFDKMKNMLLQAKERVYLSVSDTILEEILDLIGKLEERNIKVVLLTDSMINLENTAYRTVYQSSTQKFQIRLIVDSKKVLTGEADEQKECTCLYSENKNLVDVFKDMLKNEITLINYQQKNSD